MKIDFCRIRMIKEVSDKVFKSTKLIVVTQDKNIIDEFKKHGIKGFWRKHEKDD